MHASFPRVPPLSSFTATSLWKCIVMMNDVKRSRRSPRKRFDLAAKRTAVWGEGVWIQRVRLVETRWTRHIDISVAAPVLDKTLVKWVVPSWTLLFFDSCWRVSRVSLPASPSRSSGHFWFCSDPLCSCSRVWGLDFLYFSFRVCGSIFVPLFIK